MRPPKLSSFTQEASRPGTSPAQLVADMAVFFDLAFGNFLSPLDSWIAIGFPHVDLHTPAVCVLGDNGF
jgi:hypothetical protein